MNPSLGPSDDVHSLRGAPASTLRPLSAIAATRKGGVPERRICRILVDLAGPLSALHRSGRVHGAITYDSIGLDTHGRADLIVPPMNFPRAASDMALREGRASGFNAFEQYTDDPGWPVGPWTDVYALCATAYRLITGDMPPSAIDRCVQDGYVPLARRDLQGYGAPLLAALDRGLALRPHDRPEDLMPLLVATGMSVQAAQQVCREGELFDALDDLRDAPGADRNNAQAPTPPESSLARPGDARRRSDSRSPLSALVPACRLLRGSTPLFFVPFGLAVVLLGMWFCLQTQPLARGDTGPSGFFPALTRSTSEAPARPGLSLERPAIASATPEPLAGTDLLPEAAAGAGLLPKSAAHIDLPSEPAAAAGVLSDAGAGRAPARPAVPVRNPHIARTAPAASEPVGRPLAAPPVQVAVDIRPWGEVYIDGVKRGVSPPLHQLALSPGTYQVSIRNPHAMAHQYSLTVRSDRTSVAIKHQFPLD